MSFLDKVTERLEAVALQEWPGDGFVVKKFEALDVAIVKDLIGRCFLISTKKEGLGRAKHIINFGGCNETLDEKGVLEQLKSFCFKPLKAGITEDAQEDFDILLGYAVPMKVLRCDAFVECINLELENMKKHVKAEEVESKFQPLYESIDLAAGAAKMELVYENDPDELFKIITI